MLESSVRTLQYFVWCMYDKLKDSSWTAKVAQRTQKNLARGIAEQDAWREAVKHKYFHYLAIANQIICLLHSGYGDRYGRQCKG